MSFFSPRSAPTDEGRYNLRTSDSPQSIDNTTLNDNDPIDQIDLDEEMDDAASSKYDEKYRNERNAIHDAQSVRYTAYSFTAKQDSGDSIVNELRNVGVTVLSLETLSTSKLIQYMDAVTKMRIGDATDEKCMLYTDRMGRVFNVVISGGAEGLSEQWSVIQAVYSGWSAIAFIPFLARVIVSYSFDGNGSDEVKSVSSMAINPLLLLLIFGLILHNETSHVWLSMNIFVRGSNSVGSHVWRGSGLTDYPRMLLLLVLALASVASPSSPVRDMLTLSGSIFGTLLLLCNLGSRGWKKADLSLIDNANLFTPCVVILASIFAGLVFPFMGLRSVHGVTVDDNAKTEDVEKVIFHRSGKDARQNITVATAAVALVYLLSDVHQVQEALGFNFTGGILNLAVGGWLFLSSLISMAMCHRLNLSRSKKIEPFLRRDETSPVGWIIPSIPNIVIDPILSRSNTHVSCLSLGSDIMCSVVVSGITFLIIWTGIRELQGYESNVWEFEF